MCKEKFESKFFKKNPIQPPKGALPFANSRFQLGVTVMGFAEHFGQGLLCGFSQELFDATFNSLLTLS